MKFRPWGQRYNPNMYYALDHDCVCGWGYTSQKVPIEDRNKEYAKHIVGFYTDGPKSSNPETIGIFIFECPGCFQLFWYHVSGESIKLYKNLCPLWPK